MRDILDRLFDSKISIWKKGGSGVIDNYGIESQLFTLLIEGIKCRFDPGPGKEVVSDAGFGTQTYTFFTRPFTVDFPPVPLNIHHWIQINNQYGVDIAFPSPNGIMYDIKNVKNMGGHHLEIEALLVEP